MVGKKGKFCTLNGFTYEGEVVGENDTHWTIHDFRTGRDISLLKTNIERIVWGE